MEAVHSLLGAGPVVAALLPAWLERLDGANAIIGVVTLLIGLLGVLYLVVVFVAMPVPQTAEVSAEEMAYPTADRFLIPLFLPLAVILVIATVIFLTSQILLVVPESVATPIALALALFVLITCTLVANAPRVHPAAIFALIAVSVLALFIVGGTAAGIRRHEADLAAIARANAPQTELTEITTDNKFSNVAYTVPAGQAITLTQQNKGLAIHNWHVLDVKDTDGKDIMTPLTQPGGTAKVTFTISTPGHYKFQCDVHPTEMVGVLTVVP